MKRLLLCAALLLAAGPAAAQLSGPVMLGSTGPLAQRPYWSFVGGGTACVPATVLGFPALQCTLPAGAGGTLQTAYNNSAGASPSIQLAAPNGPVDIKGPAAALGTLLRVRTTGGTDILNLTDNGASAIVSQAALTLTGVAASTWSTSAGALTVSGFAGINEQVAGTTYLDLGVTAANQTTLGAGITLAGAAGTGALSLGSMTGAATLPTGSLSWAAAGAATGSLVSAGAFTITGGAASTWSTSAGALTLDSAAALNLGTTNATSIVVGPVAGGSTTTVRGGLTQLTGAVSLTGNAASSFTTSAGALTLTSAAAATWSTSAGALSVTSADALTLTAAAASTWSTSAGALSITGTGGLALKSSTATATLLNANGATIDGVVIGANTVDVQVASVAIFRGGTTAWFPLIDNSRSLGAASFRWTTVFGVNLSFATNINHTAAATVTGTAGAATVAGFSWTHTGAAGGVANAGAAGAGGLVSVTAGTGGADAAAGGAAAVGGVFTGQGGTGGAANNAGTGGAGATANLIGGTGGAAVGGLTNGAGGAVNVTGGVAGAGAGVGNVGGAVNVTGGAAAGGSGNLAGGSVVLTGGAALGTGTKGSIQVASQNLLLLGVFTTAQLPAACTNGQIVWDSTTTQIKFCLANVFTPLESSSDFNFSAFNSLTSTALIGPLSQTTVTNAATIKDAKYTVEIASADGAGDNFIIKLCSDGGTCDAGSTYVTCTTLCNAAASTVTTCTINIAAVPAATPTAPVVST